MAVLTMSWSQLSLAQDADADAEKAKPLSKKVLQAVDKIIPTIRHRDENEFLRLSMPLIKSSKPEQLEVIDQMCLDHGVTKVTDWFAKLVVDKALQASIQPELPKVDRWHELCCLELPTTWRSLSNRLPGMSVSYTHLTLPTILLV